MRIGVREGLQSIGNGCGLQMKGFSANFEPSGSIFDDFQESNDFAIVSNDLTPFPEGPRALVLGYKPSSRVKAHLPGAMPSSRVKSLVVE